ncbi:MAG: hypothetical protein GDA56_26150 [Hormoscilla sp. GM7CHS1pb]|nr:hypothetical protein [Hormoscilla sp. GM7CHS1pb]
MAIAVSGRLPVGLGDTANPSGLTISPFKNPVLPIPASVLLITPRRLTEQQLPWAFLWQMEAPNNFVFINFGVRQIVLLDKAKVPSPLLLGPWRSPVAITGLDSPRSTR